MSEDRPEAETALQEAARRDPDSDETQHGMGIRLHNQSMFAEAEAAFREAVRLDPGNVFYHNDVARARALMAQKHPETEPTYREAEHPRPARVESEFGILRLEINGSWSAKAFVQLLTELEHAYFAAAALESLAEPWKMGVSITGTAKELLDAVVAFRLGEGLQVRSLPLWVRWFIEVIGAFNPLKTVKDGVTENREINRKREETRLFDERERQRQSEEHEQAIEEHRHVEQMRLTHDREMARIQIEAETARVQALLRIIDRLAPEQRTTAAADLFQIVTRNTENIANDARLGEVKMLRNRCASG